MTTTSRQPVSRVGQADIAATAHDEDKEQRDDRGAPALTNAVPFITRWTGETERHVGRAAP